MNIDYTRGVVGRDPIGKTITETLIEAHPDWSDQRIAARVNVEAGSQVMDAAEVAHWRAGAQR